MLTGLWPAGGRGAGWEGDLPDVPLALSGAVAGRSLSGARKLAMLFPQKLSKGLSKVEERIWNVLLLSLRATVPWGSTAICPLGFALLFHMRLSVCQRPSMEGGENAQPSGGEPQGPPHPTVGTPAKAVHVVGSVVRVWDDDTANGEPGPSPASQEGQCGDPERGKVPK